MKKKAKSILAIDLGGTLTKLGLFSPELKLLKKTSLPTEVEWGPKQAIQKWIELALNWSTHFQIAAIGIASPGPLDTKKGCILETPNLEGWENVSFTKSLSKALRTEAIIENDANLAGYAEWKKSRHNDVVTLTLGTGVGSGVVLGGQLLLGCGLATELGHMTIDQNGPVCACGKRGCLEVFVGGRGLLKNYLERGGRASSVKEVFASAASDESLAQELIAQWTKALAIGVGNILNIFNPREVVLAGGLSGSFPQVKNEFQKILITQSFKESLKWCEVRKSRLDDNSGLLGAASWAQDRL
ncbi:MAG: ROK family protein [Oligoflexia bacterium]|nr:ROK family protein [Oligoflexia bacterium]